MIELPKSPVMTPPSPVEVLGDGGLIELELVLEAVALLWVRGPRNLEDDLADIARE